METNAFFLQAQHIFNTLYKEEMYNSQKFLAIFSAEEKASSTIFASWVDREGYTLAVSRKAHLIVKAVIEVLRATYDDFLFDFAIIPDITQPTNSSSSLRSCVFVKVDGYTYQITNKLHSYASLVFEHEDEFEDVCDSLFEEIEDALIDNFDLADFPEEDEESFPPQIDSDEFEDWGPGTEQFT